MGKRDWDAEIDEWTERFRDVENPPPEFAHAISHGWDPEVRRRLVEGAQEHERVQEGFLAQLRAEGCTVARVDLNGPGCDVCIPFSRRPFALSDDHPTLPPHPPMPLCPACRHRVNLLTPYFLSTLGLTEAELTDEPLPDDDMTP